MKNLTPTQFLMYATALTVGAALALPAIPWLRPVGILIFSTAGAAVRGQEHIRRHLGWSLTSMVFLMAAAVAGALQPQGSPDSYRPRAWYAVVIVMAWSLALISELRRWRRITRNETLDA